MLPPGLSATYWAARSATASCTRPATSKGAAQRRDDRVPRVVRLHAADLPHDEYHGHHFGARRAFFFAEVIIGPMWSIPMDIAGKFAGTASGLMNSGSALAAILSPLAFGMVADATGNWVLPFAGSLGLLLLGATLAPLMHPERPFEDTRRERRYRQAWVAQCRGNLQSIADCRSTDCRIVALDGAEMN